MAEVRMRYSFYGDVQGVGFRYRALRLARQFQLTGWVRNEWDGSVSMEVQGQKFLIEEMVERLRAGEIISVDRIEAEELPTLKEQSFSVKE